MPTKEPDCSLDHELYTSEDAQFRSQFLSPKLALVAGLVVVLRLEPRASMHACDCYYLRLQCRSTLVACVSRGVAAVSF